MPAPDADGVALPTPMVVVALGVVSVGLVDSPSVPMVLIGII
jgi:hypothetical protein